MFIYLITTITLCSHDKECSDAKTSLPSKMQDSQHSYSLFILSAFSIPKHSWVSLFHVKPVYLFSGLDKKQITNESVYPIRSLVNSALFAIPVVFLHVIPATKNKGQI